MTIDFMKRQRGVSLVEVLVAILVIGIGMLGVMGLQGRALQHSQQSYLHGQAMLLANDMADRIRLNRGVASRYRLEVGDPLPSVADNQCIANACTVSQLADWDMRVWRQSLLNALPQGEAEIKEDVADEQYTIIVRYVDEVKANDNNHNDQAGKSIVQITIQI